jgi:hypothetical protein
MKTRLLQRHNFIFLLSLLFGLLTSCIDTPRTVSKDQQQYSSNQRYLFQLLDDYQKKYYAANEVNVSENVRAIFQDGMKRFLVDSLGRYIDGMTVIVNSVVQKDWLVTTQFHSRNIEFKYGMRFHQSMTPAEDSIYNFMKGFIPGQEVTVAFVHLGGGELNYPDDMTKRTMRIFAYPVPLQIAK